MNIFRKTCILSLFVFIALLALCACGADDGSDTETPSSFTVTFVTNGGSPVDPVVVERGTTFTFPFPPTRPNHVFDGWYLDDGSFEIRMLATDVVGETTLYAKWLPLPSWEGDFIWFGMYPQSLKDDDVTVGMTPDGDGYYTGSDGARYAKVLASPFGDGYVFATGQAIVDQSVHYFKVEPIKWRVLDVSGDVALIMAASILDNRMYDEERNHYADSEIRAWLNDTFIETAFNASERQRILTTHVVNNVQSTGYTSNPHVCENTDDEIFLLSHHEATHPAFGLHVASSRRLLTSDYSRALGVWMNTGGFYGHGGWTLRSPSRYHQGHVRSVSDGGNLYDVIVHSTGAGTVPAMRIVWP